MNTLESNILFYVIDQRQAVFYGFNFKTHGPYMTLLNLWGGLKPLKFGKSTSYYDVRFFLITEDFIILFETLEKELKRNSNEKDTKKGVINLVKQLKKNMGLIIAYVRPLFDISNYERRLICYQVNYLNKGLSIEKAISDFKEYYKPWLNIYISFQFGNAKHTSGQKENKKCRFCDRYESLGATFREVAHATPDSLGNNLLFSYEECDECNDKFGKGVELDFIKYLNLSRTLHKIKNKKGKLNVIVGENFCTDRTGNIYVEEITQKEKETGFKQLKANDTITLQGMYRAMVKFVINLIPNEYLSEFQETIKWIKGEIVPTQLPWVKHQITKVIKSQPFLTVYLNENKNPDYPYCIASLHCLDVIWCFIVPFSHSDHGNFMEKDALMKLNDFIEKFEFLGGEFEDYRSLEPRTVWKFVRVDDLSLIPNLEEKKKELDHSTPSHHQKKHVDFPPLNPHSIKFESFKELYFKEYISYPNLPENVHKLGTRIQTNKIWIKQNGDIKFVTELEVLNNLNRKVFDYAQEVNFTLLNLKDSLLISLDEVDSEPLISLDIYVMLYFYKKSQIYCYEMLRYVHNQPFELEDYDINNQIAAISKFNIFIELTNEKYLYIPTNKLWNIDILHLS